MNKFNNWLDKLVFDFYCKSGSYLFSEFKKDEVNLTKDTMYSEIIEKDNLSFWIFQFETVSIKLEH